MDFEATPMDLSEIEEFTQTLLELRRRRLVLNRKESAKSQASAGPVKSFAVDNRSRPLTLASAGKELKDNFLKELAEREEANRSGKMTPIIFIRDHNTLGQEVSGYIDYAHRLRTQDFEPYFSGKKKLMPGHWDLCYYNWRTQVSVSSSSSNNNPSGLLFRNKRNKRTLNVDPLLELFSMLTACYGGHGMLILLPSDVQGRRNALIISSRAPLKEEPSRMALYSRFVVVLLYGWSYLCVGYCVMLKTDNFPERRKVDFTHSVDKKQLAAEEQDLLSQDTMTEHMQMLYAKYNRAGFPFKDGNTVRSFKAHWGMIHKKQLQIFNLTSLTKSEDILSATLHYYIGDLQNSTQGRHGPRRHSHIHIIIWSFASVDNRTRTLGHVRINVSTLYRDFISWQWKDVTRVVNQAKNHDQLLIGIDVISQGPRPWKRLLSDRSPYILVYANDSAISEPESVVATLQRHHLVGAEGSVSFHKPGLREHNSTKLEQLKPRHKRSVNILLPLQNNELPGPEYPYETTGWDETIPYEPIENKQARRPRKKTRKNQRHKMPLLQFDEQTIKKARKKQWNEPRNCARRYLKVDFADIGWSDWIISPKSFDAYYCSGSCQFPMPKALKPSNHATIQSIVRAVGVVPGIPEPCCVPEKMSSLSILFFDEDKNVVLKVYPNMTVDSCACR
ncbi:bone morphogenetic protein 3 [Xyrichtys novacula]|uniref:Bone morphogenetic protein 3 n=1 Tax=Xyrichtys novacula TaxID=13765 RepID=A0AAV1G9L1_XYRNO|nr:bone morphogenetic protein 3 [Xyrichtys novacula]